MRTALDVGQDDGDVGAPSRGSGAGLSPVASSRRRAYLNCKISMINTITSTLHWPLSKHHLLSILPQHEVVTEWAWCWDGEVLEMA